MGTSASAPTWMAFLAIAATPFFGNVNFFIAALFFLAPVLLALTGHHFLKEFSTNRWLTTSGAVLYALSPVAISAINSGRLSTLIVLLLLPLLAIAARGWFEIEEFSWRKVFALSLLVSIIFAFSPFIFILGIEENLGVIEIFSN